MVKPTLGELIVSRTFIAPSQAVWKAWTEPERFRRWWGPKHFIAPEIKMDFRVGGRYLYCMRAPDGTEHWSTGAFREIVPMEKIVYTDSFANEHGNIVPATHYGMSRDVPSEMLVTVTFAAEGEKTTMTLRHAGMPVGTMQQQASVGWNESFDKLAASLS